jgi:DNA-binding Xre family transcriptional regulator
MLIDLIEMLFDEWYIEREKRTQRLAQITALSEQKANELEAAKLAKLADPAIPPEAVKA